MASFKLTSKDGEWPLSQGGNLVGCAGHCGVRVEAPNVAGEHARVDVVEDRLLLTDLDSETGTFLDDVLVRGTVPIEVGQTLRVGSKPLRLKRVPAKNGRLPRAPLRRAARVGLKLALGTLASLIVFLVVLSLIFNADRLRRDIVKGIESTVDRDAEIGKIELRFFRGRTELRDVVVHNLPEFGEEPFIKAPSASARFHSGRYLGSLGTRLRAEVTLERPVVLLERNERGDWNVGDLVRRMARKLFAAGKDMSWDCPYSGLELHLRARDATLRIRDDLAGQSTEITGISFDADLPRLGCPLTYRLAMEVPVGGQPGKVELTGSVALFRDGKLTVSSVKGEILRLKVAGLDLRALPGTLGAASRTDSADSGKSAGRRRCAPPLLREFPHGAALDLDIAVSADSLGAVRSRVDGCLRGPHSRRASAPELVSFNADLSGALVPPRIERGEVALHGPGWKLDCQGRLIPALPEGREPGEAVGGAELLDLDAVFQADLNRLDGLLGLLPGAAGRRLRPPVPMDGRFFVELSTSGPTRELAVSVKMGAEGLVCPPTGAPSEDVSIGLEGSVRLAGWSGLDGASIKACTAEASFIHASVAPGEVSLLTTPRLASALLGPLEFDLDLEELGRRYGPLLPFPLPPWRLHGWAELEGSGGRLRARSAVVSRSGGTAEGAATVELAAKDGPRVELDWRARGSEGSHARVRGGVTFGEEETSFEATASASGDLSRVLETARPYLRPAESLWARGRFNLDDVRASGTPSRFSTTGRLELLEFELWGGSPTTPPFSESRFESNWNLDFDLSRGPARMQANLLKGSSSTLQFKLSGDVSDLGRGLGRYDLQAFADFDRLGAMLKKLALVPASAALRGTMNVELKADTKRGDIDLGRLELDTPFIEARGGGKIRQVPLASLLALVYPGDNEGGKATGARRRAGALSARGEAQAPPAADGRNGSRAVSRPAEVAVAGLPEEVSGKLHVAAKLNVDEIAGLVRSLPSGRPDPGARSGPGAEATGEIGLDVTAEGSGGELILSGKIDLDKFAGRLGRHVRKSTEELASLGFSASVATGRPALVILRSGVLTLGGAERPATFDLEGSLARGLDRFDLACSSERFEIEPVAPLLEDLAPGCTGVASVDIRSRGELARGALVPGTLALDGEIGLRGAELRLRRYPELRAKADGLVRFAGRSLSGDGLTVALMLEAAGTRARVRPPRDPRRPAGRAGAPRKVGVLKLVTFGLRPRRDPPGMSLSFDARADELDLGTLVSGLWVEGSAASLGGTARLQKRTASTGPSVLPRAEGAVAPYSGPGLHLDGRLSVGRACVWPGRCTLEKLAARAELENGRLRLREIAAELWGGRLSGEASVDLAGPRPGVRGELKAEQVDLVEAAKAAAIPGALTGKAGMSLSWEGEGLGRRDVERDWEFDIECGAGAVAVRADLFPFAREVRGALAKIFGTTGPPGGSRSKPVTVRLACRRGRLTMEAADFEFEDGLALVVRGRTELDGRIAWWVTVKRLPGKGVGIPPARRSVIDELVRRGALRFAVTGTWERPVVDVKGLLSWILPEER